MIERARQWHEGAVLSVCHRLTTVSQDLRSFQPPRRTMSPEPRSIRSFPGTNSVEIDVRHGDESMLQHLRRVPLLACPACPAAQTSSITLLDKLDKPVVAPDARFLADLKLLLHTSRFSRRPSRGPRGSGRRSGRENRRERLADHLDDLVTASPLSFAEAGAVASIVSLRRRSFEPSASLPVQNAQSSIVQAGDSKNAGPCLSASYA